MTTVEPPNPYAAPAAPLNETPSDAQRAAAGDLLASRWQRLGGSFVDGLIYLVATVPVYFGVGFMELGRRQQQTSNPFVMFTGSGKWGLIAALLLLGTWAIQWSLLAKRGQTVGKIVAGTRVVMLDGSRAPFWNVVVLRTMSVALLNYIPKVGPAVGMIDILFIFRGDKRCLHDLLAGTKVVDAAAAAMATGAAPQGPPAI